MSEIIHSTYEILKEIGSGGGGVVYLANHINLNKKIVLKADKRKVTTKIETLRREVDVMKNLSHTNIPQVYDFFIENGIVYTAIDYINGESLDKPLKRGEKFSQPQVVEWAIQLLEALEYLHSPTHGDPPKGYVHSDIKPANLMRTPDNNICLIDFNISLALGELTSVGKSIGYSSPEHYGIDYSIGGSENRSDSETVANTSAIPAPKEKHTEKTQVGNTIIEEQIDEKTAELTVFEENQSMQSQNIIISDSSSKQLSSSSETTIDSPATIKQEQKKTEVQSKTEKTSSTKKKIMPDVRSDIYMVGATLYHLLSGNRPAKDAKEVVPLSCNDFSLQIVEVISKAMNPNPDFRYQTATEMIDAFKNLGINDSRVIKFKKQNRITLSLLTFVLTASIFVSFTGLKRMQIVSHWHNLINRSNQELQNGNREKAIEYALEAIPTKKGIFTPLVSADAQLALTNALGVYDLADGYKIYKTLSLPSEPLFIKISPDGKTASCICLNRLVIIDTETCQIIDTLETVDSALAEVVYTDNDNIIYAGKSGVEKYNISSHSKIWSGNKATTVSLSADTKIVATVYKDESFAYVYDSENGEKICTVDFYDNKQKVTVNDRFANPNDNLFSLNNNGTLLAVSFNDGSLMLYDVLVGDTLIEPIKSDSGYSHFEGGFYENYFSFSASSNEDSIFAVIDTNTIEQTGGFQSPAPFSVNADEFGIKVQTDDILVKINPQTGEQEPLVNLSEPIWCFASNSDNTVVSTKDNITFFNKNAYEISYYKSNSRADILELSGDISIVGSLDSPLIQIFKYNYHADKNFITYNADYKHNETRISHDWNTVMLFSYNGFRIYNNSGEQIADVQIPEAEQVNDQQFIRQKEHSYLEVRYNNGKIIEYDSFTGDIISEYISEKPDMTLYEEFKTQDYLIKNPLHGIQEVYNIRSGKLIKSFDEDAYMTYVTQSDEMLIVQYINGDGDCYGKIYNSKLEEIAELPYLCDIIDNNLIFDYPYGTIKYSSIYNLKQLLDISKR